MTDYTEADAAAETEGQVLVYAKLWAADTVAASLFPDDETANICGRELGKAFIRLKAERDQLRTENARLTAELAAARQAASDWRTLLACGCAPTEYLAACVARSDNPDFQRMIWRHYDSLLKVPGLTAEVRDAARRLAAPHLNPKKD